MEEREVYAQRLLEMEPITRQFTGTVTNATKYLSGKKAMLEAQRRYLVRVAAESCSCSLVDSKRDISGSFINYAALAHLELTSHSAMISCTGETQSAGHESSQSVHVEERTPHDKSYMTKPFLLPVGSADSVDLVFDLVIHPALYLQYTDEEVLCFFSVITRTPFALTYISGDADLSSESSVLAYATRIDDIAAQDVAEVASAGAPKFWEGLKLPRDGEHLAAGLSISASIGSLRSNETRCSSLSHSLSKWRVTFPNVSVSAVDGLQSVHFLCVSHPPTRFGQIPSVLVPALVVYSPRVVVCHVASPQFMTTLRADCLSREKQRSMDGLTNSSSLQESGSRLQGELCIDTHEVLAHTEISLHMQQTSGQPVCIFSTQYDQNHLAQYVTESCGENSESVTGDDCHRSAHVTTRWVLPIDFSLLDMGNHCSTGGRGGVAMGNGYSRRSSLTLDATFSNEGSSRCVLQVDVRLACLPHHLFRQTFPVDHVEPCAKGAPCDSKSRNSLLKAKSATILEMKKLSLTSSKVLSHRKQGCFIPHLVVGSIVLFDSGIVFTYESEGGALGVGVSFLHTQIGYVSVQLCEIEAQWGVYREEGAISCDPPLNYQSWVLRAASSGHGSRGTCILLTESHTGKSFLGNLCCAGGLRIASLFDMNDTVVLRPEIFFDTPLKSGAVVKQQAYLARCHSLLLLYSTGELYLVSCRGETVSLLRRCRSFLVWEVNNGTCRFTCVCTLSGQPRQGIDVYRLKSNALRRILHLPSEEPNEQLTLIGLVVLSTKTAASAALLCTSSSIELLLGGESWAHRCLYRVPRKFEDIWPESRVIVAVCAGPAAGSRQDAEEGNIAAFILLSCGALFIVSRTVVDDAVDVKECHASHSIQNLCPVHRVPGTLDFWDSSSDSNTVCRLCDLSQLQMRHCRVQPVAGGLGKGVLYLCGLNISTKKLTRGTVLLE